MPTTTPGARIDLDSPSISALDGLKAIGVPQPTIALLKQFRGTGGQIRSRRDLVMIGLTKSAIDDLLKVSDVVIPALPPLRPLPLPKPTKSVTVPILPPGLTGHDLVFFARESGS